MTNTELPDLSNVPWYLPEALAAFERVTRKPPFPELVYHYTTADGLLGILRSETIWASNCRYMNDTSELAYGRRIVHDVISDESRTATGRTRTWLSEIAQIIEGVHDQAETYVACFCETNDLLSQWRAYGTGRGFALGFSGPHLSRLGTVAFIRVEYEPTVQMAAVRETLKIHLREVEKALATQDTSRIPEISGALGVMLALWPTALKHPSFSEEKEWRLCPLSLIQPVKVRSDRGWLRPYVEISMAEGGTPGPLPLRSITHGPSPHPELEKRSLRLLLEGTKYVDVSIAGSVVPLRI